MNKIQSAKSNSFNREPNAEEIFNELNIVYRVCVKFVPNSDDTDLCVCNRPSSHDHSKDQAKTDEKWDMQHNTCVRLNPEHGKLPNSAWFTRLALDTHVVKVEKILTNVWKLSQPRLIMSIIGGAKYFTLSDRVETNFINGIINVALKSDAWILTNGYNVGIVQLVGQAIHKSKLTNPKKAITAIGLCKWGSVKDVEKLTSPKQAHEAKTRLSLQEQHDVMKKRESGQRDLELNHSHYLMLDDGRMRHYDIGDYRTRLCSHLAKLQDENDFPIPVVTMVVEGGRDTIANIYYDLRANIPVVLIDGSGRVADFFKRWLMYTKKFDDPSAESQEVYDINEIDAVEPITTLPVLVNDGKKHDFYSIQVKLDNSRRALEQIFAEYNDQLTKDLDAIISQDENRKKANERSKKIEVAKYHVMYCLQPMVRSGITIFNLNSDNNNLSEVIFRSICKSRQEYFKRKENSQNETMERKQQSVKPPMGEKDKQRQMNSNQIVNKKDQNAQRSQLLQLAMDWDCVDVAKELILQNSLDNILNKEQAFLHALTNNLPNFIYEFIKLGIDPCEIFFPDGEFFKGQLRYRKFLQNLYSADLIIKNCDKAELDSFIQSDHDVIGKHIDTVDALNDVLSRITGGYMHKLYFNTQEDEKRYRYLWGLDERNHRETMTQINVHLIDLPDDSNDRENQQLMRDYVMRDLFLWAILMNRIEMAQVFLCYMKYRMCAALIATKILKEYHKKAIHGELKESYLKSAEYFQQYAIECINQCEKNDANQACQIVLQRIELFGYVTCLQVAADAKDKMFIARPCCVQAMDNIWYDKIYSEDLGTTNEVLLTICFLTFGFFAPFLVSYRKGAQGPKDEPLTEFCQSYGINYSDPYPLEYPRFTNVRSIDNYMNRFKNFHQAPRIKYCYQWTTYAVFLLLFSYVLLFQFQPATEKTPSIHWTEIAIIILVSLMLIEEINSFVSLDNVKLAGKFQSYFTNLFKLMTLLAFVLFYIGLVLRFTYADTPTEFTAARVVMALDLEIWWLRCLYFIVIIPFLGPHLVAIGKMLKDLLFFMCIIAIVMTGYGVSSRSMVYYANPDIFTDIDTSFNGRSIFRQIAYPVYYLMYGETGDELADLDKAPDAGWSISTQVLLAVHMLFVNILLTNLLIAMFSKRFDQVYDDTKNIWHSQQYFFTREYYFRSPFFPPFSFLYDIYQLLRTTVYTLRRLCLKKSSDRRAKVFKIIPKSNDVIKDWYEFEGASTYEYAHAEVKAAKANSATVMNKSESNTSENREEINEYHSDSTKSFDNMQQVKDDLEKVNRSLEKLTAQLEILATEIKSKKRTA